MEDTVRRSYSARGRQLPFRGHGENPPTNDFMDLAILRRIGYDQIAHGPVTEAVKSNMVKLKDTYRPRDN